MAAPTDFVEPTPEPRLAGLLVAAGVVLVVVAASVAFFVVLGDEDDGQRETFDTLNYEGRVAWQTTIDTGDSTRSGRIIGASADVVIVSYRSTPDSPIVLLGLERSTGEERWRRDFDVPADVISAGFSSPRPVEASPGHWVNPEEAFVHDDAVIVVPELDTDIVVLEAATGAERWRRAGLWIVLRPDLWTVHGGPQPIAVDPGTGEPHGDPTSQPGDDVERPELTIDIGPGLSTQVLAPRDGRVLVGCRNDADVFDVTAVRVDIDGVPTEEFVPCEAAVPVVKVPVTTFGERDVGSAWIEPVSVGGTQLDRLVAVVLEATAGIVVGGDDVRAEDEPPLQIARVADSLVVVDSTGMIAEPVGFTILGSDEPPVVVDESSPGAFVDGGILTYGSDTGIVTLIE